MLLWTIAHSARRNRTIVTLVDRVLLALEQVACNADILELLLLNGLLTRLNWLLQTVTYNAILVV